MHEKKPFGLFGTATESEIALASKLSAAVENERLVGGLEQLKRTIELPDGSSMTAILAGGTRRVIVTKPSGEERRLPLREDLESETSPWIPLLVSGAVLQPTPRGDAGVEIRVTRGTRDRLIGYDKGAPLPPQHQELRRFRVKYPDHVGYFEPQNTGTLFHSQYGKFRSTWFSGAMREVAQIILGYGSRPIEGEGGFGEPATLSVPASVVARASAELKGLPPTAYKGVPGREGHLLYNHTPFNNDLIAFDSGNRPWLVNVSSSGVYVMELPMIKLTTTIAFREYMEEVGDEEILRILDRFGGMPSGETMPVGRKRGMWEKAGLIIKICETDPFYSRNPMYAACGWSSNTRGSEMFNTAFDYADNGLLTVHSLMLHISLGEARRTKKWNQSEHSPEVSAHLAAVILAADDEDRPMLSYKFTQLSFPEIGALAKALGNPRAALDYWLNLELSPVAQCSGGMSVVAQGPVYHGNKLPGSQGRLKFPDLMGQGCVSFDMTSPDYEGGDVECDTTVFGYYNGDSLKVVKYFTTESVVDEDLGEPFPECMTIGEWEQHSHHGQGAIRGKFYTSDFDERDTVAPSTTRTKIKGEDLGFSEPEYRTPPVPLKNGSVSRSRYIRRTTDVVHENGEDLDVAVCAPCFEREAVVYPFTNSSGGGWVSKEVSRRVFGDPNRYELWTYDSIWHWVGRSGAGSPRPKIGEYVYIDTHTHNPTGCSDFADEGPFLGSPIIDVSGMLSPYTYRHAETHHAGGVVVGGQAPKIRESYSEERTGERVKEKSMSIDASAIRYSGKMKLEPGDFYFLWSPQDDLYLICNMVATTCGDTHYAKINSQNKEEEFGHTTLGDDARCFIGVINE